MHGRFSIHPRSVETCRQILDSAGIDHEGMTDWEVVKLVESTHRFAVAFTKAQQSLMRAASGASARLAELVETMQAMQLVEETEMFLAIDHS